MNEYQALTLIIAIIGVILSLVSLTRARRVQDQQLRLQLKQEELTDLQVTVLKAEVERRKEVGITAGVADVRVSLEGSSRHYRFVIRNWGLGPASNIQVEISPLGGRNSPLVEKDYKEKMPIPRLAPGAECSLIAAISFTTGTTFDAKWTWENDDGASVRQSSRLSL